MIDILMIKIIPRTHKIALTAILSALVYMRFSFPLSQLFALYFVLCSAIIMAARWKYARSIISYGPRRSPPEQIVAEGKQLYLVTSAWGFCAAKILEIGVSGAGEGWRLVWWAAVASPFCAGLLEAIRRCRI